MKKKSATKNDLINAIESAAYTAKLRFNFIKKLAECGKHLMPDCASVDDWNNLLTRQCPEESDLIWIINVQPDEVVRFAVLDPKVSSSVINLVSGLLTQIKHLWSCTKRTIDLTWMPTDHIVAHFKASKKKQSPLPDYLEQNLDYIEQIRPVLISTKHPVLGNVSCLRIVTRKDAEYVDALDKRKRGLFYRAMIEKSTFDDVIIRPLEDMRTMLTYEVLTDFVNNI